MPCPRHSMALYFIHFIVITVQGFSPTKPTQARHHHLLHPWVYGQSLPSKPSTFGKHFGQGHTRRKFQKRLLVKHPASALFFSSPSSASIAPFAVVRRKCFQPINGQSKDTRPCPSVVRKWGYHRRPRRKSKHVPAALEHCASLGVQLQRPYLVIDNCHSRQTSCKARRLIMHMHANPALGTGCYSPRKLQPFQGVKEIARPWLPSS